MGKKGQHTYKGINAQAWAAMSLFLQYLKAPNFAYIHLEAPGFEDFNLVFKDGKKIICESKAHEQKFSYSQLKNVLHSVLSKNAVKKQDEILIICTNIDDKLKADVEHTRYGKEFLTPRFKRKKFTEPQIDILDRVKFWKVQEENNCLIVYSLFNELLNFWLPEHELDANVDSILIKEIYKGSAKGSIYKKEDVLSKIETIRERASKDGGYFDKERTTVEKQFQNIIKALDDNKSPVWAPSQLKAISSNPTLLFFVLDQFKQRKVHALEDWDDLWLLYKTYQFSFSFFKIFENNLDNDANRRYLLRFLGSNVRSIKRFYQKDFFDVAVVKIAKKILMLDKTLSNQIFGIVRKLVDTHREEILYVNTLENYFQDWELGEISKLVKDIYDVADSPLKDKIVDVIFARFNLVEGVGGFYRRTPNEIFEIIKDWLEKDLESNLTRFLHESIKQYVRFYKKRFGLTFDGWDVIPMGSYGYGSDYRVPDKQFISDVLSPAFTKYYQTSQNKKKAWKFVLTKCITKTKGVNKEKPDFLNRSVLPILLERYANKNPMVARDAFDILKEFILSLEGIPKKSELVYQLVCQDKRLTDKKKWKLVEIVTRRDTTPQDAFVEEIIAGLAKNNHREAKKMLEKWFDEKRYYQTFGVRYLETIRTLMASNLVYAVKLFEKCINSEYFVNQQDYFKAYESAGILYDILKKDFESGIKILRNVVGQRKLTKNQQILATFSLFNYTGGEDSDNQELLIKVYKEFIDPLLRGKDIKQITQKFPFSPAREALIQFACRLANNKNVGEAIRIINLFINDPDPYPPNKNPDYSENKDNAHKNILEGQVPHAITSVRGWCAWALMKCVILGGRGYIPRIIALTEQLSKDENWYVKHAACFALSQLAETRLKVLPNERKVLFFNDDKGTALLMAKRVEKISFDLLDDIADASPNVQKALVESIVSVFTRIRALNEKDAWKLMVALKEFPLEARVEAATLLIYYAEFRKNSYRTWQFTMPGLYDDLGPNRFNEVKFQRVLLEAIDSLEPDKRFVFAAQFKKILRDANPSTGEGKRLFLVAYSYLDHLSNEFGHEVFQIVYSAISEGLEAGHAFSKLYTLFIKCLQKEKEFYEKNQPNLAKWYYWPSPYNGKILRVICKKGGKKKFLDALEIILTFPKELEINIDDIIPLIENFLKSNKHTQTIVDIIFQRNPNKYYELRKRWSGST